MVAWKWPLYAGSIPYPTWAYTIAAAVPLVILAPLIVMAILHVWDRISLGVRLKDMYVLTVNDQLPYIFKLLSR